eukprot:UN07150
MVIGIQAMMILIFLITAQFLAWMFVYKLFKIKAAVVNDQVSNNDLLKTMQKYSVLSVVSVMLTTLYAVAAAIGSSMGFRHSIAVVLAVILCLDVFIDSMCMTLSLKVNDKYYGMICCLFTRSSNNNNKQFKRTLEFSSEIAVTTMDISPDESSV